MLSFYRRRKVVIRRFLMGGGNRKDRVWGDDVDVVFSRAGGDLKFDNLNAVCTAKLPCLFVHAIQRHERSPRGRRVFPA
jgi:hypothetical protein